MTINFAHKNYTNKIPTKVRAAMQGFTNGECVLVKRKKIDIENVGAQGNCHINVKRAIEKHGGKMINGWLLYRKNVFINDGFFAWSFHSIWETVDGDWLDVTEDATYEGAEYSTFWIDTKRNVDLVEGINYNNIVALEDRRYADLFAKSIQQHVDLGEIYWADDSFRFIKKLDEHSGKYRWITSNYANNIKQLEKDYDVKIIDDKLVPNDKNSQHVNIDIFFDYSLNAGRG